MNTVTLTGNLTRDPELRMAGEQQRPVCELRIAVDNGRDRDPTYVDVSTFDAQAQACARYLAKGRQVAISGRLVYREWKAEDGSARSKHSVIGRVEFLGKRPQGEPTEAQPAAKASNDDDIPF
jgi:single-strand DNA-binding protein